MSFETTIALADLKPKPDILWVRHKFFLVGVVLLMGSFLTLLATVAARESAPEREGLVINLGSTSLRDFFLGSVILSFTYRKVKFLRFNSHFGTVLLDVADSGPDRAHFASFTDGLIGGILGEPKDRLSRVTRINEQTCYG